MFVNGRESAFLRRSKTGFHDLKRRAKKDRLDLSYSLDQFRRHVRDAGNCPYCGAMLTVDTYSLDHAIPVSREVSQRIHSLENLAVCCQRCNEAKGNMSAEEFRALLRLVSGFYLAARTNLLARLRAGAKKVAGKGW